MHRHTAAWFLVGALGACTGSGADGDCATDKCDESASGFKAELEGRNDPIAKWLRASEIDDNGNIEADYGRVAQEIATVQGCADESWRTFVISDDLVVGEPFPRLISTVCSDNTERASEFFIAASFKNNQTEDVDTERLEMFAWDADARTYRFYKTERSSGGKVQFHIEPEECRGCHLTPRELAPDGMSMTPIMNELTKPWAHWGAETPLLSGSGVPDIPQEFELPADLLEKKDFSRYALERPGSARDLEQIIRAGHTKVAFERYRSRRTRNEDWNPAMNAMRPFFCEEQLQYTTEEGGTGQIAVTTVIPGGIREAFLAFRPDNWPTEWRWLHNQDGRMRLAPATDGVTVVMAPVRGNADIDYENRLVQPSVNALTPHQILQIRALDWQTAVLSDFRCSLWSDALARYASAAPDYEPGARNVTTMQALYSQILEMGETSLLSSAPEEKLIVLNKATGESIAALEAAIAGGSIETASCDTDGFCVATIDQFGELVSQHVSAFESGDPSQVRKQILAERDQALCQAKRSFGAIPALPAVQCQ